MTTEQQETYTFQEIMAQEKADPASVFYVWQEDVPLYTWTTPCPRRDWAEKALADAQANGRAEKYILGNSLEHDKAIAAWNDQQIAGSLHKLTKDEYWDALECLPPEAWHLGDDWEHFRMSEYQHGSCTHQYARLRIAGQNYYASKLIDVSRPQTWITVADVRTVHGLDGAA